MSKLITATLLALGFGLVWGVAGAWVWDLTKRATRDNTFGERFSPPEYLVIKSDGTPLIKRLAPQGWIEEYRDLEGHPVEVAEENWLAVGRLRARAADQPLMFADEFRPDMWRQPLWSQRLRAFSDYRQAPNAPHVWWLVTEERSPRSAYFVGYDQVTNARAGFLGVQGFRETEPPADERFRLSTGDETLWANIHALQNSYVGPYYPFPSIKPAMRADEIPPWFVYVLTDDGKIHQIDLSRRSVHPLPLAEPVRAINFGQPRNGQVLLARTADEILQINVHDKIVGRVPIPQELREEHFNWSETSTGDCIAYTASSEPRTMALHIHYYWIDRDGTVTRQTQFTLEGYNPLYSSVQRILPGALVPAPVGAVGFVGVYWPLMLLDTGQASAAQAWPRALDEFWPSVLLTLLVSGTLAGMCYCRQSRYRAGRVERLLWPLFVFVLGVPGWIGYRFGRSWPVLEKCPSCSRPVPQDRPACAACHTEFPLPALKGTEVFA